MKLILKEQQVCPNGENIKDKNVKKITDYKYMTNEIPEK